MPVFYIPEDYFVFPHPRLASEEGVLGIGANLHPDRLLLAYQFGIFPWYSEGEPILWWSPHTRFVVYPDEVIISKSMRPYFNKEKYELKVDESFEQVIRNCQKIKRPGQDGTWITEDMVESYTELHKRGYAHSFETYENGRLVGGLYGIALGKVFFGESMFSLEKNASKYAFISLCKILQNWGFWIIDCQQPNSHLKTLGGRDLEGSRFFELLKKNCFEPSYEGSWSELVTEKIII